MNAKHKYIPQDKYRKKQQEKGLKRISIWVPEDDIEKLKDYAEKLRRNKL